MVVNAFIGVLGKVRRHGIVGECMEGGDTLAGLTLSSAHATTLGSNLAILQLSHQ